MSKDLYMSVFIGGSAVSQICK